MAGGQRGPGDVHAHAPAGAGNKPNLLVGVGDRSPPRLVVSGRTSHPVRAGSSPEQNSRWLPRMGGGSLRLALIVGA
ncbi:MAG: hypothetical protein AVDCRST_MAG05-4912 [uncultured Rubrobacteraceae bacterium]|uniref:Uncharacterized protein n=1 Tax=uncultured Rubrobacteraceae bacterium TaxID=349277 RepID=A0A6J4TZ42_9ACTN|nr:MAG: hypothetical protein AVDCRST_MAG05-4912 [uncultured Rubrobacteraceae bacterium]